MYKLKKKIDPSKVLLGVAKSISFNTQNYIPKEGASFSLFRIEILSGLTVALALVPEAIAFAFVAGVAPLSGLYAAFIVGLIVSALVFAWKSASRIRAIERPSIREKGAKVYEIEGPLFFSSTNSFLEIFKPSEDPEVIIIDFERSKVIDQSALKAIVDIADKYNSLGKKVKLRHLTRDCHKLLSRAGQLVVDSDDDPDYGIAVDYDVKLGIFGR